MFKRYFSIILLIFINNCDLPNNPIESQILEILDIQVDYNVNTEQLYIVSKINHFEQVHLIWAAFYLSNGLDTTNKILNDDGLNGDILPTDGSFSNQSIIPDFEYGTYMFEINIIDSTGIEYYESYEIIIEENFQPKIIDIQLPEIYWLPEIEQTYLEILIWVSDENGLDDIKNVRYLINVDDMDGTENGFISDPSWIMNFLETDDDGSYKYSTSIPMTPVQEGGNTGIAIFQFIITDSENLTNSNQNIEEFTKDITIVKCGEGFWDCVVNCQECIEECGECDE